jgi:hypothetical protein
MISNMIQKIAYLHFKRFLVPSSFKPPMNFLKILKILKQPQNDVSYHKVNTSP